MNEFENARDTLVIRRGLVTQCGAVMRLSAIKIFAISEDKQHKALHDSEDAGKISEFPVRDWLTRLQMIAG